MKITYLKVLTREYSGETMMQMQPNPSAPPPMLLPIYHPFYYGSLAPATAAAASTAAPLPIPSQNVKETNGSGSQELPTFNTGFYPEVEGHTSQSAANSELLHPHFNQMGAHYDNPYGYHLPLTPYAGLTGQNSGTSLTSDQRYHSAGYGSERYDASSDATNPAKV